MRSNYLFGPFIGETIYELNYFVGHAIYLRKRDPRNKIIVLTRKENFDLYGKYATTLIPLPLSKELKPNKFSCNGMHFHLFDEMVRRFKLKYRNKIKVHGHFYPHITTHLKNLKWYYPRNEIDFDFKTRPKNFIIARDICKKSKDFIISDFQNDITSDSQYIFFPVSYLFNELNITSVPDVTSIGILIEMIRLAKYVCADIDSLTGRLAMLVRKPLITKRSFLDVQYLNPINPYKSIVIGCENLSKGIRYLEGMK